MKLVPCEVSASDKLFFSIVHITFILSNNNTNIAVISIVPYLINKGEHTMVYKKISETYKISI